LKLAAQLQNTIDSMEEKYTHVQLENERLQ